MMDNAASRLFTLSAVVLSLALPACDSGPQTTVRPRHLVLVSLDTLSALHVGAYGYGRPTTPTLDSLADEGTLFERAYTPQSWTLSAHASLLTGLYPATHGATKHLPLRSGAVTLAETLSRAGFDTFGLHGAVTWLNPGFGFARGFDHYASTQNQPRHHDRQVRRFLERQTAASARNPAQRFFLFLHYFEPHSDSGTDVPYWAPPPFDLQFLDGVLDWERRGDTSMLMELQRDGATLRDRDVIGALYDGGVRYTDWDRLRPVIGWLRELALLDETLVVVTADHGEEIYEHGHFIHQQPYEETVRVPLVLRGPGVPAGMRVSELVDLVDVMPTLLSLLGVPTPGNVQGRDLTGLWRGTGIEPRMAFVDGILGAAPPYLSVEPSGVVAELDGRRVSLVTRLTPTQHVGDSETRHFAIGGEPELYLLDDDPGQARDVAAEHPALVDRMERALLDWYAENEAARVRLGEPGDRLEMLSEAMREELRALGYGADEPAPSAR